jgi:hypothetical protein
MNRATLFDEVGLAYAQRFADLEGARAAFSDQRDAALAHLDKRLTEQLRALGSTLTKSRGATEGVLYYGDPESKYQKAREARGRKGYAGVQLELRALDAHGHSDTFGFAASAYFGMGRPQLGRLQTNASFVGLQLTELFHRGTYLYVPAAVLPIGDALTLEACERAVARLVTDYPRIDAALGDAVEAESSAVIDESE